MALAAALLAPYEQPAVIPAILNLNVSAAKLAPANTIANKQHFVV
jgi:hypothetical protein